MIYSYYKFEHSYRIAKQLVCMMKLAKVVKILLVEFSRQPSLWLLYLSILLSWLLLKFLEVPSIFQWNKDLAVELCTWSELQHADAWFQQKYWPGHYASTVMKWYQHSSIHNLDSWILLPRQLPQLPQC